MQHLGTEFESFMGQSDAAIGRRDFLKIAVGATLAATFLPASAKTVIHTDVDGLKEGEFTLDIDGQPVPVYMAQPRDKSNLPIMLVISEVFGLHEHIADVARRFAKQGYLAIAPELFVRQGDPANYDNIAQLNKEVVSKVPDSQVIADLDACIAWAKRNGGNPDKIAVSGFGWGGRFVWLYAAHNPSVKAGVEWYARLVADTTLATMNPENPIDIAAQLTTPILGLHGGKDIGVSMASIQQMKEVLAQGSSHSEIVLYPKTGHAFFADYRNSYVPEDAKDSWKRCLDWLRAHGME